MIVELERDGKNFVIGIHLNQLRKGLVVNDVRGMFPKNNAEWLNWISQNKTLFVDKEKIQTLIDKQRTNLAEVEYLDLDNVVKVVENFENPKTGNENLRQDAGGDTGQDARDIPRYHIEAERSEKAGRNVISSNQASSGADTPGL